MLPMGEITVRLWWGRGPTLPIPLEHQDTVRRVDDLPDVQSVWCCGSALLYQPYGQGAKFVKVVIYVDGAGCVSNLWIG